jgi:hypothetical protein
MDRAELLALLTAGVADIDESASATDIAAISERLGSAAAQQNAAAQHESIREVYRRIIDTDAFRAACGRIAASYAW